MVYYIISGAARVHMSCLVTGEGLHSSTGPEEAERIHKENVEKLKTLSQEQILQERDRLMSQLGENMHIYKDSPS